MMAMSAFCYFFAYSISTDLQVSEYYYYSTQKGIPVVLWDAHQTNLFRRQTRYLAIVAPNMACSISQNSLFAM